MGFQPLISLTCAAKWEKDSAYWLGLAAEEDGHAGMVLKMRSLVAARPELYSLSRTTDPEYYRSFIAWIEANTEEVEHEGSEKDKAVKAALEIENSVYENKLQGLFTTSDKEFEALVAEIIAQTRRHCAMVKAKAGNLIK